MLAPRWLIAVGNVPGTIEMNMSPDASTIVAKQSKEITCKLLSAAPRHFSPEIVRAAARTADGSFLPNFSVIRSTQVIAVCRNSKSCVPSIIMTSWGRKARHVVWEA